MLSQSFRYQFRRLIVEKQGINLFSEFRMRDDFGSNSFRVLTFDVGLMLGIRRIIFTTFPRSFFELVGNRAVPEACSFLDVTKRISFVC